MANKEDDTVQREMVKVVADMMRSAGDSATSDSEAVELMLDIARKYMLQLLNKAVGTAQRNGASKVSVDDVVFSTRGEPAVHAHVAFFLDAKTARSQAEKAGPGDGDGGDGDGDMALGDDDDDDDEADVGDDGESEADDDGEDDDDEAEDDDGGHELVTEEMAQKKAAALAAAHKSQRKRKRNTHTLMSFVYQLPRDALEYTGVHPDKIEASIDRALDIRHLYHRKRLKQDVELTEDLSKEEYFEFADSRKQSFFRGSQERKRNFRTWLALARFGIKMTDPALELVAHLGRERVRDVTLLALDVKAVADAAAVRGVAAAAAAGGSGGVRKRQDAGAAARTGVFETVVALQPPHVLEAFRRIQQRQRKVSLV